VTIKGPKPPSKTCSGQAKKIVDEDEDDGPVADSKSRIQHVSWNLPCTDQLIEWLEDNIEDRQKLFSDLAQDAKEENHCHCTAKGSKTCFHVKMAHYIFSVDENVRIRDDVKVNGANDYAKIVENCIAM
jgi:hypothetical protein